MNTKQPSFEERIKRMFEIAKGLHAAADAVWDEGQRMQAVHDNYRNRPQRKSGQK